MGAAHRTMSASLHYTPVRELHNYRDQYAPSFKPYTSSATYPGGETNKYKPDPKVGGARDPHGSSEFAGRAGEHGGSFYNHRPNEVGWTSGPYSGHDARHSGFNPGSHQPQTWTTATEVHGSSACDPLHARQSSSYRRSRMSQRPRQSLQNPDR